MNPNQPDPSQMLPSNLLRGGQTSPGQIFQQNPMAQNMSPAAMGGDPSLAQQPPVGSQAIDQTMPQQGQPGLPGQPQPMDESKMILDALIERGKHHSKVEAKTLDTLIKMITAGLPAQDPNQNPPTA